MVRARRLVEKPAIFIDERFAAIEHQQHQVRDVSGVGTAGHAFGFDDVPRGAPAGRVDEGHGDALDVDRLGDQVARGTRNGRDDRSIRSS